MDQFSLSITRRTLPLVTVIEVSVTQILRNAAGALKKGGRLLYSTCTVDPAENERVSEAFLSGGGFEKLAERQIFTGEEICGSSGDGFYYCLMRKNDL